MPLAHRRLYGWDEENEEWVKILVDEDGKLTLSPDIGVEVGGVTAQRVFDLNINDLLGEIINQLKIMNTHLSILTRQEIT
jgi:hypothetical protein